MADGNLNGKQGQDRAAVGGGTKTSLSADLVSRAASGMKTLKDGVLGFFTPVKPMPPVAQEETQGRRLDYPIAFNIVNRPRRDEQNGSGITFEMLRNLADNYDLLRLVIETRKDQLCGMSWNIVGREKDDKIKNTDARVKKIEKFLRRPDGKLDWNTWLRTVVEDMLVIDAATIYPRKTRGGEPHSLEIVDGGTIKLLIDNDGRTPLPPEPAYVQILKGMNAAHYTTEELMYRPRNLRSWKMYGMSPVEQVIMTVNIALRRQVSQLQYYTEGNVPEALATCPPEWTPEQVNRMQELWDSLIEGNMKIKRHMRFVPGGTSLQFTKDQQLKDSMDEWLARIICYAFSVSPQALIQMMNRATAETAAEQAALEGLAPLQLWVKALIDDIIEQQFGYDDLVFEWDSGEELDPKTQSEINKTYIECGVLDVEEVRKDLGRDPRNARPATQPAAPGALAPEGDQGATGTNLQPSVGEAGDAVAAASGVADPLNPVPAAGGESGTTTQPAGGATAPAGAAATGGSDLTIQDTAMNGTQISSLLEIVTAVANKELPEATARAMINAAFPFIKEDLVNGMLAGLEKFEPPKPEPLLGPDGQPIAPPLPGAKPKTVGAIPAKGDKEQAGAGEKEGGDNAAEGEDTAEKHHHAHSLSKARTRNSNSPARRAQQKELKKSLTAVLESVGEEVARQVVKRRKEPEQVNKATGGADADWIDEIIGALKIDFSDAADSMEAALVVTATGAAESSLNKIKSKHEDALDLANTRAEKWAKARAGELIKSDAGGGELSDSTREMIRGTIVAAEEEGWSNDRLAKELRESYGFSKQRADTIARTETKFADSEGSMIAWKSSGVKMKKEWVRSANDYDCDICEANEQQGPIDLDDDFDSGDETTPAHPNCECIVSPVVDLENI